MTENIHKYRILVLNFGFRYTQLVACRMCELGIYCELWAWDVAEAQICGFNPGDIILSGGSENTTEENSPRASQYVFGAGIPVSGVCYGIQTMAMQLGGHVEASGEREFGYVQVETVNDNILIRGIEDTLTADGKPLLDVWMSHDDKVAAIPSNFATVASTKNCSFIIMTSKEERFYGVQFHPEVTHTRQGTCMLERLVRDICQCEASRTPAKITDNAVARIHEQVGDDRVTLGLSDGADSSVIAMLLRRIIGRNLICVFIDNGLLRLNEVEQALDMSGGHFGLNIVHIPIENHFLSALAGKNDPETKRKIIGRVFVETLDEEALKLEDVKWLAQSIICPDVIKSTAPAAGKAHVIRSHHNVGDLPREMKTGLAESLKELFKDEIRRIGLELDLLYDMLCRYSFPGPGPNVRIPGEVKRGYRDLLRHANVIFIEELRKVDLYDRASQASTVLPSVYPIGIMDDGRKHGWVVSLRTVEAIGFMIAHQVHLPYGFLGRVSNRVTNEMNGISRMVCDISGKPLATIEWE